MNIINIILIFLFIWVVAELIKAACSDEEFTNESFYDDDDL